MGDEDAVLTLDDTPRNGYKLSWFFESEGDYGSSIGDNASDSEERDIVAAIMSAGLEWDAVHDFGGYLWWSDTKAKKALAVALATIKARKANRVIPEWEKQAIANGWKAPKGWGK